MEKVNSYLVANLKSDLLNISFNLIYDVIY